MKENTIPMSSFNKQLRQYLYLSDFTDWFGITLTLKQVVEGVQIDHIRSSQNLRHFLNLLNKKLFGNSSFRNNKKVEIIPVLEQSYSGRFHFHLVMKKPVFSSSFYFTQQIRTLWNKTKWGYNEIHIDQPIDNGWINYITKTRSSDKIDWVNFNRNN